MPNSSPAVDAVVDGPAAGPRTAAREALLEAAQRLLVEVGYAKVTTRRLAAAAGVNQGLVHYYFGSLEEVLFQALERFSEQLLARQRELYARPGPFLEKWRTAMGYLEEDLAAGFPKVGFELAALGWNNPRFRVRAAAVVEEWRALLRDAFAASLAEHDVDRDRFPPEGIVSLVVTFNLGYMFESLVGIETGHAELLAMIERWFVELFGDQAHS